VRFGGRSYDVTVTPGAAGQLAVTVGATLCTVIVNGGRRRRHDDSGRAGDGPDRVVAPMPGKVVRVLVAAGDAVRARQGLAVVEAMKMENELRAGRDGIVAKIHVKEGASVDAGALLFEIR
jgi:biotin carboxyl carrier protein